MSDGTNPDPPDDYWTRTTSPDRAHVWLVDAWDVKMSHWILGGNLWRRDPPATLFVAPHGWSFEERTWRSSDVLTLAGRRYPGRLPGVTVTLDVRSGVGSIEPDDLAAWQAKGGYAQVKPSEVPVAPRGELPFADVAAWLEAFPQV